MKLFLVEMGKLEENMRIIYLSTLKHDEYTLVPALVLVKN